MINCKIIFTHLFSKINFNLVRKIIKISILLNLCIGLLEFITFIFIYGHGINSSDINNNIGKNDDIDLNIDVVDVKEKREGNIDIDYNSNTYFDDESKHSNSMHLNQNQRNVTIEIPTYESDVSEPQFQFNLISPSPNETWTIGWLICRSIVYNINYLL